MKKLIAVLVLFTLLAAAAFADVEVGAEFKGSWFVLEGAKDEGPLGNDLKPKPWTRSAFGGHNLRGRAIVNAVNEEETLGGWLEITGLPGFAARGNVWWQPVSPFKATLGYIWGDVNMAGDIVTVDDDLLPVQFFGRYDADRYTAWTGRVIHGWGWESEDAAATIEVRPVEGLYIAATVPLVQQDKFIFSDKTSAGDIFAQTAVRIAYTIGSAGQIAINWDGGTMKKFRVETEDENGTSILEEAYDPAFIGAHFNLLAVEDLELSIGFEYPLPIKKYHRDYNNFDATKYGTGPDPDDTGYGATGKAEKPADLEKAHGKFKRQLPIGLDIRFNVTASDFNFGFGFAAYLAGYEEIGGKREMDPIEFGITMNPSYAFDALTLGLVSEVGFSTEGNKVSYNILPYVKKELSAGAVYAGVQVLGDSKGSIGWSIPIGFVISF